MMKFDEYRSYDAVGLAGLVAKGDVSASELLNIALTRLAAVNPSVNAVVNILEDQARATIAKGVPAGPLAGVPFLLKDIIAQMRDVPTTAGSRVFVDARPADDSAIVRAYRAAGLVMFGKTNTPEFGLAPTTEPVLFGPTRNPWNVELSTGGSSGGAAAAVASAIVPAAHASDGGGSIRIPASCCGLVGLKPSRGRVSMAPIGEGWGGMSAQHAVTRSVRDSAAFLDVECQPQSGDPYWLAPPPRPFVDEIKREPDKLRIGFTTAALTWGTLDAPCVRAVNQTAALCDSLGHHVEETVVPGNFQMMAVAMNVIVSANVAAMLEREANRRGSAIREDEVERLSWSVYQEGKRATAAQYAEAIQILHGFSRELCRAFEKYDVILLSTLGKLPIPLGFLDTNAADLSSYGDRLYRFMPNTQPFNVSGLPAISLPLECSDEGLPIGVQFAAQSGEEGLLLKLAAQLEEARPWRDRRPPI